MTYLKIEAVGELVQIREFILEVVSREKLALVRCCILWSTRRNFATLLLFHRRPVGFSITSKRARTISKSTPCCAVQRGLWPRRSASRIGASAVC